MNAGGGYDPPLAKPRRRWLAPVLGSAAVLLLIAIITPLALFLPAAPVAAPAAPFAAPATVMATPTPPFAGDNLVSVGSSVFRARGCSACHTIDSVPHARGQVGPNLSGVGTKGADFIRTSICDPDAVLAEGFAPGIMPLNFCDVLTQEEIDAIVTFLLEQQ